MIGFLFNFFNIDFRASEIITMFLGYAEENLLQNTSTFLVWSLSWNIWGKNVLCSAGRGDST